MTRLLHLNASPRGRRSRSLAIATTLIDQLAAGLPGLRVTRIDLFKADLPRFDAAAVEGRYALLAGTAVAAHEEAAWEQMRAAAAQALAHDLWLISTPMWNFVLPFPLKQWIDAVTHPGLLFEVDGKGAVTGLAAGRRLLIVAASAMPFTPDPAMAALDFQAAYLRAWGGFIGISQIDEVRIAPTYGAHETVAAAMDRGHADAQALAGLIMAEARAGAPG